MRVILASASPRRHELLDLIGIAHEVVPADVDESVHVGEAPVEYVERVARAKAATVAAAHLDSIVIAADTTVVLNGEILAKPADAAEARRMLWQLSGWKHEVLTGIAVARRSEMQSAVERVDVTFRKLEKREIDMYVKTGEPLDKAGAYGIQGYGATLIDRVDGDYFSVMGLGLRRLVELLARVGIEYRFSESIVDSRASRATAERRGSNG